VNVPQAFAATAHEQRSLSVQQFARALFGFTTVLLVLPVLGILVVLAVRGAPGMSFDFFLTEPINNMKAGGILPALVGTVWLTLGALMVALPLGVAAAIYLSEYARDTWLTRTINLAIVNLAGVPSIVHALFGVGAFVHFLHFGKSILAASCTLAVMTLPVVIVATRESLQAVPKSFRDACWCLGASRWQTIWRVVLPNSGSGILTGVILCVSRAVGETAPIMFTGAAFYLPMAPHSVFDQTMALSLHLYNVSTQVNGVPEHLPFAVALTLICVVLAMNAFAIWMRMRLRGRKKW
jgi:phosphate transport system permease protein